MKQRITIKQLRELSPAAQKKLREWWKPEEGDHFYDYNRRHYQEQMSYRDWEEQIFFYGDDSYDSIVPKERALPLLSIGQMIEFMGNKGFSLTNYLNHETGADIDWRILFDGSDGLRGYQDSHSNHELCDALWQAVKDKLSKNE